MEKVPEADTSRQVEKGNPCEKCSKEYRHRRGLLRHIKTTHENHPKEFICKKTNCKKKFGRMEELTRHEKCHQPGKLTCETCKATFKHKFDLTRHVKQHENNPTRFTCDQCGANYSRRHNLKKHEKDHSEETTDWNNVAEEEDFKILNKTHKELVAGEKPDWAIKWVRNEEEQIRLRRIMTGEISSQRHRMFMNPKQQEIKGSLPNLYKLANCQFPTIFSKQSNQIDREVIEELTDIFDNQVNQEDTAKELKEILERGTHIKFNYITLVLYPETFVAWIRKKLGGIDRIKANRIFREIGAETVRMEGDTLDIFN